MTITDLCEETRNWFDVSRHFGEWEIISGTISLDFLQEGQFFRIVGSVFNDGVYEYNDELELKDEAFKGAVWALAIPPAVVEFVEKASQWEQDNAEAINGAFASESFGGYSYSTGTSGGEGLSWKTHFKKDIERWQKI